MSNETVVDQRTGTTNSEMFTADAVDEDCGSDTSTTTNLLIRRGTEDPEKGLGGVAPFIERNPDKMASTLEWRGSVLRSKEATQASTSSRQQSTAEERGRASLEESEEIDQIQKHYQELERVLEGGACGTQEEVQAGDQGVERGGEGREALSR